MNELESVMRYSGPRRSCLVVPGNKPNVLEKARGLAADEIIIDLEDTVPPEQKDDALRQVVGFLNACDGMQKRLTVRVNDTSTSRCHRDVLTLIEHASAHLDAIMLPMTETAGQVQFMHWLMHGAEAANGVRRPIGLVLQLETSAGLLAAPELARASTRVDSLTFGPSDYAKSLGTPTLTAAAHQEALTRIVLAARAAGVRSIDGPYLDAADMEGFKSRLQLSRGLGAHGIWCVHPSQIALANEAFAA